MMPLIPLPPDECVNRFLQQADRLGVEVRWTKQAMNNLDAAYRASPGVPGVIVLHDSATRPNSERLCTLLSHEMVHVLQHWKGDLRAVPPLGWPRNGVPAGRNLSEQEQEAYAAQSNHRKVLHAVSELKPATPQTSP